MEDNFSEIKQRVLARRKYNTINHSLIDQVINNEIIKGRRVKEAEKAVLSKLHQIGKAYFSGKPDFAKWKTDLENLDGQIRSESTRAFCRKVMQEHHSTHERLPILENFFDEILSDIGEITSVLDLACGFNPLAYPWMPVNKNTVYYGCDIFSDLTEFLNAFWRHFNLKGGFHNCNVFDLQFENKVQVALVLKSLTCLEQIEKGFSYQFLKAVPSKFLVISYPVSSLSGIGKGMRRTYTSQFESLIKKTGWDYREFTFSSELVFLVKKS